MEILNYKKDRYGIVDLFEESIKLIKKTIRLLFYSH